MENEKKCISSSNNQTQENLQKEVVHFVEGGWWGWLVVLASFCCIFVLDGIGYSFGVFLEPLLEEIKEGRGLLSVAGSMQIGVYGFSSPIVAKLVNRYGERKICSIGALISAVGLLLASFATGIWTLIVCYSIVCGVGFGLMYLPSIVIVSKHFLTKRSLATGIVLCAAGVGTFVIAPITQSMVEQWGWRGAMKGLALMCLACLICGLAMSPGNKLEESSNGDVGGSVYRERVERPCLSFILGNELASASALPVLVLLATGDMLATLSIYIPFTHLPSAAVSRGISASNSALLVSAIGVTNTLGRLAAGWFSDKPWLHPLYLTTSAIFCAFPALYLLSLVASFWLFLPLSCIFGFLYGVWVGATPPALIKLLGVQMLGPAFGLLTALRGAAALGGPPLAGLVVDILNDKRIALVVAGAGMTLSSLFYILASLVNSGRLSRTRRGYQEI